MLRLNLKPILKLRGIERGYTALTRFGISKHMATKILNGKCTGLSFRDIEKLCIGLHCGVTDIFVWEPDEKVNSPEEHPLAELTQPVEAINWREKLKKIPVDELDEIVKTIEERESA